MYKANFLVEPPDSFTSGAKNPGHAAVIAHDRSDEGAPDTLMAVLLGDNQHGYVAVCHAISEGAQKANDLALLNRHKCPLGSRYQFAKVVGVGYAMRPATGHEESPCRFQFRRLNFADIHTMYCFRHER